MADEQRNAEIWSTRVQRELLALTTENAAEDVAGILPNFITVHHHELDIAKGTCTVHFVVDIIPKEEAKPSEDDSETTETKKEGDEAEAPKEESAEPEGKKIVIILDVSLRKYEDGRINTSVVTYPFEKPRVILKSGAEYFPEGSTIENGNYIDIDCDWTPSLHLTDAALNVGLKMKESIKQQEPFHEAKQPDVDPIEELVKGAKRFSNTFARGLKGLNFGGTDKEPKKQKRPKKNIQTINTMKNAMKNNPIRMPRRKKVERQKAASIEEVRIGSEINLLESPWADCQGVYSCKAIRRPGFVEAALAEADIDHKEVASAGFAGAGAMLRSFTQSARSVLEDSFLMITDSHIIEMRSSKLNLSTGTVTLAVPVDMLAKLKFRRQESISLFFKPAPDDPLIYMCPDSADCVHQIQSVLKRHGVKGKHTNAATQRAINEALQLVQEIQTKEIALKHDPTVARVNEIMDLYRQAAERFEVAGDVRHEEVVTHMRKFLALPFTTSILDGSYKPKAQRSGSTKDGSVPVGEVLERTSAQLEDHDHGDGTRKDSSDDRLFEQNMENILREAKDDFAKIGLDSDDSTKQSSSYEDGNDGVSSDALADLDAMLNEADKELAALMSS